MLSTAAMWGFSSFILFKILFDATYHTPVSIIGSLLLGGMIGLTIYKCSIFYAGVMGKHLARIRLNQSSDYWGGCLQVLLATSVINIFLGKALVFGFAKEFNRELGGKLFFKDGYYAEDGFIFACIVVIPLIAHFLTVIFSIKTFEKNLSSANQS